MPFPLLDVSVAIYIPKFYSNLYILIFRDRHLTIVRVVVSESSLAPGKPSHHLTSAS